MAPVVKQAPTVVQMPPMSAADKYKAYVRSNTNPSHQFDDNMKEPNNNNPGYKNQQFNNNNNKLNGENIVNSDAPQFFTCHTSYSCTPAVIPMGQSNQNNESPKKIVEAENGKLQPGFGSNNVLLNNVESGKPGPNAQFNNVNQQTTQLNNLKNTECGKPAPHAQFNNVKNAPIIPSPLVISNDLPPQQLPRQRKTSNPEPRQRKTSLGERPQGNFGLAHSHSSPSISTKEPSKNESLVLHYFQNPHTYKNLQERQLPGQGPVPKSMLPPPAPPADKRKSTSPRRRSSVTKSEPGESKDQDWSKMLTQFYQW